MTTPAPPPHAASAVAVRRLFAAALCAWAPVVLWYAHSAGVRHDYRHYLPQWQLVLRGANPWSTDNAYGPLYNVLAYLLGFGPLGPKLAMAGCLVLAVGLLGRALLRARAPVSSLLVYLVVLPGNCLVISVGFAYGLNDTLAAALVSFALLARLRERDVAAGVLLGLAVLLKYYPAVLVPWFALEHGRVRWRLPAAAGVTVGLGLAAAAGVWGASFLTAFTYGAEREPKLLSVLAALQAKPELVGGSGVLDVLIRFNSVCVVCVVVLSFALGLRLRLHFLEASVLGLLATLLTFKVGHPQFYLPWLCLVAALPLAQRASADRLLWTLLPYVLFLDLFQYGYTWGANGYYHQLTEVRRFGGFVSFGLGVATIMTYAVCSRVRRPALTSQEGVSP